MRRQSWRLIIFAGIVALLSLYSSWWLGMINNPDERTTTDFMSFYASGRIAQRQGFFSIYKINLQQAVEENTIGITLSEGHVLLFIHPPQFVPILYFLLNDDYRESFIRWVFFLLLIYLATIVLLLRSLFTKAEAITKLLIAGSILTFFPLFISLWQGQDTAFLFLGVALWYVGVLKKQNIFLTIGLALITIRPHLWIMLAIPLLLKYRRPEWLIGTALITMLSLFLLGRQGTSDYINLLLISSKGQWFGLKQDVMLNLLGAIVRVFDLVDANLLSLLEWLIFALGLGSLIIIWLRSSNIDQHILGLTIVVALISAPHLYLHDLTLLIFPLLYILQSTSSIMDQVQPALIIIGTSGILLFGILIPNAYFFMPYLVYIFLVWKSLKPHVVSLASREAI